MNKILRKKILSVLVLVLVSITGVLAQQNGFNYPAGQSQTQLREMKQTQSRFSERYNFTCEGNCTSRLLENGEQRLEVRTQKRLLFWDVESLEVYDLNENGEIEKARYNIWSRLLNRERVRV